MKIRKICILCKIHKWFMELVVLFVIEIYDLKVMFIS